MDRRPRGRGVLVLGLVYAACLVVCAADEDITTPIFSWDKQASILPSTPTDASPPRLGETASWSEKSYVASKVAAATTGIDCGKAHEANQAACDAYGEHSPVCTGSQTQYVLQCGHIPKPLFSTGAHLQKTMDVPKASTASLNHPGMGTDESFDQSVFLIEEEEVALSLSGEHSAESNSTAPASIESTEKQQAANSGNITMHTTGLTLKMVTEPVLVKCKSRLTQAKMACEQKVAAGFLAWREGKAAGNSTVSEFKEELGSSAKVQSVYDEAMEALRSDPSQMASNIDVTLPGQYNTMNAISAATSISLPSIPDVPELRKADDSSAAASDVFDDIDPSFRQSEEAKIALGLSMMSDTLEDW